MKPCLRVLALLTAATAGISAQEPSPAASLFDGKTLAGWDSTKGIWRVQDGAITAGSHEKNVPKNEFISTKKSYANFELKLKIKCSGDLATGQVNSGIQIRSARLPDGAVAGYQIDCGKGWFGKIYDEHRRRLIYPTPIDEPTLSKGVDIFGWNEYRILADGPRIQVWINDIPATDYTETNPLIPLNGVIAPQIHKGGHAMVQFKDVTIRELPPTPDAPTWESLGGAEAALEKVKAPAQRKPRKGRAKQAATPAPAEAPPGGAPIAKDGAPFIYDGRGKKDTSYNNVEGDPQPASEQRKLFHVPDGYEIELVAQESEGIGKFISVYFDQRGRLWTQTALEYPVDGNQNAAVADALYKRQARDRVLVYSRESLAKIPAGGLTRPTVFADGLAMPMGMLPWGNGDSAFVLHGPDLLRLADTNGDGKSDHREVVLTGFGVQDSHLFPHQFTRAPGDWIWMAQGLFNNSEVKRPGEEKVVPWPKCSMARVRPDGSGFEVTGAGPNNIWGLALTGEGEGFIQEANDFGYPVIPFHEFAYYPGGMKALAKSYQPSFPPTAGFRMGGTSLSGLALLENGPAVNAGADLTMLVANPIISKVQTLGMHRDGPRWDLEKLSDLVTCDDPFFRPVALTQGPDGCLYIVDWYNKIISHNEVPRNHPDRDKTRGRIWRVKPIAGKGVLPTPDFTALENDELLAMLGGKPTARAHLAWQTLADRKDAAVAKALEAELESQTASDARRIQAFWALGDSGIAAGELLLSATNRNLRRELARHPALAVKLLEDSDPEVRFAALTALGRQLPADAEAILPKILASVKPSLPGPTVLCTRTSQPILAGEAYDREFARFLVRFFLERHPTMVGAFLDSDAAKALPIEGRILAALALPPAESASRVAAALAKLDRAPNAEELLRLAQFPDAPGSGEALAALLAKPDSRPEVARQLLEQRTRIDPTKIDTLLSGAARNLLQSEGDGVKTALELAGTFALSNLEPDIVALVRKQDAAPADRVAALQALRGLRSKEVELFASLASASSEHAAVRDAAFEALAASTNPDAAAKLQSLYPGLSVSQRRVALTGLSSSKPGALALVAAIKEKRIPAADLDPATGERLAAVLANDPALASLMEALGDVFGEVLSLDGKPSAFAGATLDLKGPFTVETWIRLADGITNADSILGGSKVLDLNFADSTFRVWAGPTLKNVAISNRPMAPDLWTHVAVTRDADGEVRIYTDGELDAVGSSKAPADFTDLKIGWSSPPMAGTEGALAEYRVWNRQRTAQEIRQNFDRSFAGTARLDGLIYYNAGGDKNWGELGKGASIARTTDLPPLMTLEQATALDAKFAKYMALGRKGGDVQNGMQLAALCTSCHVIDGKGGEIGPDLSGAAQMGLEAVLRNILTPNAAMESGYRIYRVEMKSGEMTDAFFVSEDKDAVVIRQIGQPDRRLPKNEIAATRFIRRSLMPEGLLDGLSEEQAADLLAYLMKGQTQDAKSPAPAGNVE